MILIDSSAWIEFLRNTGSKACVRVYNELGRKFATCDAVRMEVLSGARNEVHLQRLQGLLAIGVTLPTAPEDYETAAALYRQCRSEGETIRRLIDCLIAAVAIRSYVPVLHCDKDFEVLACHTNLQTVDLEN